MPNKTKMENEINSGRKIRKAVSAVTEEYEMVRLGFLFMKIFFCIVNFREYRVLKLSC